MTAAVESEDPHGGLGRGWVRVPGTRVYVGPLVLVLLLFLAVGGWLGAQAVYVLAAVFHGAPIREVSFLADGLVGGLTYLALMVVHEGSHALAVRGLGGRVLRFGLGGGGAHVVYTGLEHRAGANAFVAVTGPLGHAAAAGLVVLLAADGDWSRTEHAALLAVAALNMLEAAVNITPWRGPKRCSDGWNAVRYARQAWAARRASEVVGSPSSE